MAIKGIDVILAEVSDLFDSLVGPGQLQANLDHPPLASELEGRSPVHSIHYDGSLPQFGGNRSTQSDHFWRSTLYLNRRGHGSAVTETLMAQLVTAVLQIVRDNVTGTNFDEISLVAGQRIAPAFVEIDGVPYRIVEIPLQTRTHDNG